MGYDTHSPWYSFCCMTPTTARFLTFTFVMSGMTENFEELAEFVDEFKMRKQPPRLLPVIVSNVATRIPARSDVKTVDMPPSKWIRALRALIIGEDVPPKVKDLFVPSGKGTEHEEMIVPVIPRFNTTQQVSQDEGIAVPLLTNTLPSLNSGNKASLQHLEVGHYPHIRLCVYQHIIFRIFVHSQRPKLNR